MYSYLQDKIVTELKDVFGDSKRLIRMDDLPKMKYIERCIKESLRLFPPVHFISRKLNETTVLSKCLLTFFMSYVWRPELRGLYTKSLTKWLIIRYMVVFLELFTNKIHSGIYITCTEVHIHILLSSNQISAFKRRIIQHLHMFLSSNHY